MSRLTHEISQAQSALLHLHLLSSGAPQAGHSSSEHEHSSAPWFISCSIYPFKKKWTSVRTNVKCDWPALVWECRNSLSMWNAFICKWVQMMPCVKFLLSQILYAWIFLFLFWLGNFPHNFSPRFPKSQLLTSCYIICWKDSWKLWSCSAWIIQDR